MNLELGIGPGKRMNININVIVSGRFTRSWRADFLFVGG